MELPFGNSTFDLVLCQLGLQFFADRERALREMKRVLGRTGRAGLSVYGPIENTPAADAYAQALDEVFGAGASSTKKAEHAFRDPDELRSLLELAGFASIRVEAVTKRITFPSVLDYARLQLVATPMAALLADRAPSERETAIRAVAAGTAARLPREMTGAGLVFPQEAYVATGMAA